MEKTHCKRVTRCTHECQNKDECPAGLGLESGKIRTTVDRFADVMEERMMERQPSRGFRWVEMHALELILAAVTQIGKAITSVHLKDKMATKQHLADAANYLMMAFDVFCQGV